MRGNYERLVAERSDWRNVSGDIAACSGGYVVAKPEKDPGLVQNCETLLRVRDTLAGNAVLSWSADVQISEWRGLWVEGSPPRITGSLTVFPKINESSRNHVPRVGQYESLIGQDHFAIHVVTSPTCSIFGRISSGMRKRPLTCALESVLQPTETKSLITSINRLDDGITDSGLFNSS